MAAIARTPKWERIMATSGGFAYLIVRMYFARVFASSSPTVPFGGIGMGPIRRSSLLDLLRKIGLGVLSGLVLGRHFLVRGPTSFLSTVWQLKQAFSFKSSCASAAKRGRSPL